MMALQLILFRHAEAVDIGGGGNDHARGLTPRGEKQAKSTAEQLLAGGSVPSLAVVSDAARTLGTWYQAASVFNKTELVTSRDVYSAGVDGLARLLGKTEARHQCVMMIGHNPHISALASDLAGGDLRFHKADAVIFSLEAVNWSEAMAAMGDWEIKARLHAAAF